MTEVKLRFLILVVMASIPSLSLAQDTASLTGTIRDKSGAVIRAAAVVIKNPSTGLSREFNSNSDGEYVAASLSPGHYDITITARGFRKYQAKELRINNLQI